MKKGFIIKDLHVSVEDNKIIKGISLEVLPGEIHVIMGPNGSGKSTFANAVMGNPKYSVTKGEIYLDETDILSLKPDERSRSGMFLSFQYPREISGVTLASFLKQSMQAREKKNIDLREFMKALKEKMALLEMDDSFKGRFINSGFSGGEKKRSEILQMAMLNPSLAILDETDSGLDIDALRVVAEGIKKVHDDKMGIIIITHYNRILDFIAPDKVHIMIEGRIVKSGDKSLVDKLEKEGYSWLKKD